MLRRKDLRKRIDKIVKQNTESDFKPMIDYTRGTFYEKKLAELEMPKYQTGSNSRSKINPLTVH